MYRMRCTEHTRARFFRLGLTWIIAATFNQPRPRRRLHRRCRSSALSSAARRGIYIHLPSLHTWMTLPSIYPMYQFVHSSNSSPPLSVRCISIQFLQYSPDLVHPHDAMLHPSHASLPLVPSSCGGHRPSQVEYLASFQGVFHKFCNDNNFNDNSWAEAEGSPTSLRLEPSEETNRKSVEP